MTDEGGDNQIFELHEPFTLSSTEQRILGEIHRPAFRDRRRAEGHAEKPCDEGDGDFETSRDYWLRGPVLLDFLLRVPREEIDRLHFELRALKEAEDITLVDEGLFRAVLARQKCWRDEASSRRWNPDQWISRREIARRTDPRVDESWVGKVAKRDGWRVQIEKKVRYYYLPDVRKTLGLRLRETHAPPKLSDNTEWLSTTQASRCCNPPLDTSCIGKLARRHGIIRQKVRKDFFYRVQDLQRILGDRFSVPEPIVVLDWCI